LATEASVSERINLIKSSCGVGVDRSVGTTASVGGEEGEEGRRSKGHVP